MANSYITSTSRFKPYTFAEMLQPVQIYTDAYNALETELSNLDILANDIVGKLNPNDPEDAKTLKVYEAFKTKMDDALETFYREGLTPDSKKALASLKSQYSKDINPINVAYERRVKDLDFIRQQKAVNPYLIIEGIGSSTSAYMNGNSPDPVVVDLYKASEAAKNASIGLSKQFIEQIGLQGVDGYIGQYLMHGVRKGIDSTMVADFIAYVDDIKKGQIKELQTPQGLALYNMFEQIRTANNYDNLSKDAQDRLDASIVQGLVSGAAAEVDIKYLDDNQLNKELIRAQIAATRAKSTNPPGNGTDLDLRTNTRMYKGKNYDVNEIAALMSKRFEKPVEYNGTKIYDPIQAYNIIHQYDSRIEEIYKTLEEAKNRGIKTHSFISGNSSSNFNTKTVFLSTEGFSEEEINNLNSLASSMENLMSIRDSMYNDLDGIALTDKDVARIREYSKSSATGMLTQDELTNFATILASDFSAHALTEKTATIFSQTNSKDGLEDLVLTMSGYIMQQWQNGNALKITTPEGKEIKKAEFVDLLTTDKKGIDPEKISSIEMDFTAAERGAVKIVTTSGNVYYVDGDYLIDQANAFVKGANGITPDYQKLMAQDISVAAKAETLNRLLGETAVNIQSQYTNNRDQSISGTR